MESVKGFAMEGLADGLEPRPARVLSVVDEGDASKPSGAEHFEEARDPRFPLYEFVFELEEEESHRLAEGVLAGSHEVVVAGQAKFIQRVVRELIERLQIEPMGLIGGNATCEGRDKASEHSQNCDRLRHRIVSGHISGEWCQSNSATKNGFGLGMMDQTLENERQDGRRSDHKFAIDARMESIRCRSHDATDSDRDD